MNIFNDKQLCFTIGFLLNILFFFVVFKEEYITSLIMVGTVGIIKELLDSLKDDVQLFNFFNLLYVLFGGVVFTCIIGLINLFK